MHEAFASQNWSQTAQAMQSARPIPDLPIGFSGKRGPFVACVCARM